MIRIVCDRCGGVIPTPGKIGYLAWNFRDGIDGDMLGDNVLEDKDFCESCMKAVHDFINTREMKQPDPEMGGADTEMEPPDTGNETAAPEEAPDHKEKKRKRVDAGRVMALRKAGRSIAWIADDMGVSKTAVYNVLARLETAQEGEAEDNGQKAE